MEPVPLDYGPDATSNSTMTNSDDINLLRRTLQKLLNSKSLNLEQNQEAILTRIQSLLDRLDLVNQIWLLGLAKTHWQSHKFSISSKALQQFSDLCDKQLRGDAEAVQ